MKLALIGVGQAGGKVVDEFLAYDARTGADVVRGDRCQHGESGFTGLDRLPEDRRILIGQARVKGHGVGADNEMGAEIAEEDIDEIQGGARFGGGPRDRRVSRGCGARWWNRFRRCARDRPAPQADPH